MTTREMRRKRGGVADISQDQSDLSNPSNLTIIDDLNELLAEGRRRREEKRVKQEEQAQNNQSSVSRIQTSEETDEDAQGDDQPMDMNAGPSSSQKPSRPSRSRKPPERFGNAIPSNISKLFHVRGEDRRDSVFSIQEVNTQEKIINREMLDSSRQLELRGWYDFNVVREVSIFHMLRSNVRPLLTKWVDVWKTDTCGSRKMKS